MMHMSQSFGTYQHVHGKSWTMKMKHKLHVLHAKAYITKRDKHLLIVKVGEKGQ